MTFRGKLRWVAPGVATIEFDRVRTPIEWHLRDGKFVNVSLTPEEDVVVLDRVSPLSIGMYKRDGEHVALAEKVNELAEILNALLALHPELDLTEVRKPRA